MIVDIVETGSTLRENGLVVLEEVCDLSARPVVNQVSMKTENERITKIIKDFQGTFKGKREGGQMRIVKLDEASIKKYSGRYVKKRPQ